MELLRKYPTVAMFLAFFLASCLMAYGNFTVRMSTATAALFFLTLTVLRIPKRFPPFTDPYVRCALILIASAVTVACLWSVVGTPSISKRRAMPGPMLPPKADFCIIRGDGDFPLDSQGDSPQRSYVFRTVILPMLALPHSQRLVAACQSPRWTIRASGGMSVAMPTTGFRSSDTRKGRI